MTLVDRITSGLQSLTAEIKEQRPVQRTGFGLLVNSAAEANIFSYVIPAGRLGNNRTLKLEMAGDLLNNSGASQSITFGRILRAILQQAQIAGPGVGN
jgi:hypothetical protein